MKLKLIKNLQRFYTDHIDPDGIQPVHALRTVIAAILAIVLYHSFSWPQAYWILSSAVLVIQTYNGPTPRHKWMFLVITGLSVTLFTFIGGLVGHSTIAFAIFLTLTTFIGVYLNVMGSEIGASAFYVNLFCLMSGALSVDWIETVERTSSVFFGFFIAVVVCACVRPERLSSTIRSNISQNLWRLNEFNRALSSDQKNEKAIAVRRNRLMRGFQLARKTIPAEEIQSWQMIHQIEYLYEIILGLDEIKKLINEQKILRIIHKEISILSRRLNWLLRKLARSAERGSTPPPVTKFIQLLRSFEKYYSRHLKRFNQEQFLAFTVYIDIIHKLERRVITLTELVGRMGYRV
jgi:uncharacterized membrane protein YccC